MTIAMVMTLLSPDSFGNLFPIASQRQLDCSSRKAPFQYSKNTRHEKGFAVCPKFRALFFGLLISGRLTIVEWVWLC